MIWTEFYRNDNNFIISKENTLTPQLCFKSSRRFISVKMKEKYKT